MIFALFAYMAALPGYRYEFPRDHFNHPGFQMEWWYYTGNLRAADGHRFGFELTFFRKTVNERPRPGAWEIGDAYLAHLALSDIDGKEFYHAERLNRSGPGLAGVDAARRIVWNGNWKVQDGRLEAVTNQFTIQLNFESMKPPVIHGVDGVSQKAACAGCASHYISLTRLHTKGSVRLNGKRYEVEGASWMDHEFFTHQLTAEQAGWDWLSLQLDDGGELMLFRLRRKDGSIDPYSAGTAIDRKGNSRHLSANDFSMTPERAWKSPKSGGVYPVEWKISVLGKRMTLKVLLDKQEITGPMNYWEGAIKIEGERTGLGYLEMTGYDKPVDLSK